MNTYEKIATLVPEAEAFDSTAVNEGVWLTEAHLGNIETSLANADTVAATLQTQLDAEKQAVTDAQAAVTTAQETITAKDAEIETLKGEVATLKARPAADFKESGKEKDEHGGGEKKELDPVTIEANKKRVAMGKAPIQ